MNKPFAAAMIAAPVAFAEEHIREDLVILDVRFTASEGDFASLSLEVENPRIGLLAPGRPRWLWLSWNPQWDPDNSESSGAIFEDFVPLFLGRILGVPEDFDGETVTLSFVARPANYEEQKADLAASLRVLPYFDGIWFSPDDRFNPDNVLESRGVLWHIDPVTHAVTVSSITTGEDGTITVPADTALADSVRITYGDAPCRQVNVTATVNWNQIASGMVPVIGGDGMLETYYTYTGAGLVDSWPKPGASIGGGWSVSPGSYAVRTDSRGNDVWTWGNIVTQFGLASQGHAMTVPEWATEMTVGLGTHFPAHLFCVKKWTVQTALGVQYDVSRGKTETVAFALASDTQSILTDSADGHAEELTFTSSEISNPVSVSSSGDIDIPLGAPYARAYFTTDRGTASFEYLMMVARARLLAAARCVDVSFDIPWRFAVSEGISLRKSMVLEDPQLPGGIAAGKIKSFELSANGDSGVFNCNVTIGCTIGKGGTVTAVPGEPTYVDEDYVEENYQRYDGAYIMPVAGELAYADISGLAPNDDGFDFARLTLSKVIKVPLSVTNQASTQEAALPLAAHEPADVYAILNDMQTTFTFELKPLNNGPFSTTYFIDTTTLKIPKTIDLEADADSSS